MLFWNPSSKLTSLLYVPVAVVVVQIPTYVDPTLEKMKRYAVMQELACHRNQTLPQNYTFKLLNMFA